MIKDLEMGEDPASPGWAQRQHKVLTRERAGQGVRKRKGLEGRYAEDGREPRNVVLLLEAAKGRGQISLLSSEKEHSPSDTLP